jgi:hypothetical protein
MTGTTDPAAAAESIVVHAEALCDSHDHLWDVLEELSVPTDLITDRREQYKVTYRTDPVVRAFLYSAIYGYSHNRLADELARSPVLLKAFGMDSPPTQQTLNHAWHQLTPASRRLITAAGKGVAQVCADHDVIAEVLLPAATSDEQDATEDEDAAADRERIRRKTKKSVALARKHAIPEFDTNRAANKQYSDEALLDMFFRTAASNGSATAEGEVGWLLDDDHTCHGSTLLRAIKKLGTPAGETSQLGLEDFQDTDRVPDIEGVRDELMTAFDSATDNVLRTIRGETPFDDRKTVAAIDITYERFWPSPWEDKDEGIPKEEFPQMVSGYTTPEDSYARGYKYATITLVGDAPPIILGIEPVKENSQWEEGDAASYSKGSVVARLLEKAQRVADIDEVYLDREFYTMETLSAIDERDLLYTVPVPKYESDLENIEAVKQHPDADAAVLHDAYIGSGDVDHRPEFLYVPTDRDDADGNYAIFASNRESVDPAEIESVTNGYRRRWDIENQYKTVKRFKPRTASTDYRVRLAGFTLAAILYNLWRLVDYLVKAALDKPVRSSPAVSAVVFARAIGEFLRRVT